MIKIATEEERCRKCACIRSAQVAGGDTVANPEINMVSINNEEKPEGMNL